MRWLLSTLLIFMACNNENADKPNESENDSTTGTHAGATDTHTYSSIALQEGCYKMIIKKDTANLSLQIQDSLVTGNLDLWSEKDQNRGSFKGYIKDSLLIADYTFQSEGTTSVREVVFKLRNGKLYEGSGDILQQDDKVIFKQREQLQFDTTHPFVRATCKESTNQ